MSDNNFKDYFYWEQTIPEIGMKGDLFRDQIFDFRTGSSNIIKISVSLSNDHPNFRGMAKAIEGLELFSAGLFHLRLEYFINSINGRNRVSVSMPILTSGDSLEKLKSGFEIKENMRLFIISCRKLWILFWEGDKLPKYFLHTSKV